MIMNFSLHEPWRQVESLCCEPQSCCIICSDRITTCLWLCCKSHVPQELRKGADLCRENPLVSRLKNKFISRKIINPYEDIINLDHGLRGVEFGLLDMLHIASIRSWYEVREAFASRFEATPLSIYFGHSILYGRVSINQNMAFELEQ
jgi:hypothetical protein